MIKKLLILLSVLFVIASPAFAQDVGTKFGTKVTVDAVNKERNILPSSIKGQTGVAEIIGVMVQSVLGFAGVIFFILIFYSGVNWMTARGNSDKIDRAKETITSAAIGLVIVLGAYAITNFVFESIGKGSSSNVEVTTDQAATEYQNCNDSGVGSCQATCSSGFVADYTYTCPAGESCCVVSNNTCERTGNGQCRAGTCSSGEVADGGLSCPTETDTCCVPDTSNCAPAGGVCVVNTGGLGGQNCRMGTHYASNYSCAQGNVCCMPGADCRILTQANCTNESTCAYVTFSYAAGISFSGCRSASGRDACLFTRTYCDSQCGSGPASVTCQDNCARQYVSCLNNI